MGLLCYNCLKIGVKVMDLFNIIPENFFSLLSSKNKRIYSASILEVFKIYESASTTGIEKKIVLDELVNFLDNNKYNYDAEDTLDEEANPKSNRDLANYILRRLEECGWIYVDITNDYEEILNFTNAGIIISEALLQLSGKDYDDNYEEDTNYIPNNKEYQGYIYTIYSLLNNSDNIEYSVIMQEVYRNTKLLLRSIRRLDASLKTYISSVFEQAEVKELMENLVSYRENFVEQGYMKLKMGDNINRYRLRIVSKLEEYEENGNVLEAISINYPNLDKDKAITKAIRDIDEIIDVFNSLDEMITEIDEKSKTYVNSTIAKIKFLLSEDDNVIGKINKILKYVRSENKEGHIEKALKMVNGMYKLEANRSLSESSLYIPRGAYKHNYNLMLDNDTLFDFDIEADFIKQYQTPYSEEIAKSFLLNHLKDNEMYGNDVIKYDTNEDTCMLAIYSILYALEDNEEYEVLVINEKITNVNLRMKNFLIRKKV